MPGHEGNLVPAPRPLSVYEARVLESLDFLPPCQSPQCPEAAAWTGTCRSCHLVVLVCEPHLKDVVRKTTKGATCAQCRRREDSLTALWELDRTDR